MDLDPLLDSATFNEALSYLSLHTFLGGDTLADAAAGLCETTESAIAAGHDPEAARCHQLLAGWVTGVALLGGERIVADKPLVTKADLVDSRKSIVAAINAQLAERRETVTATDPAELLATVATATYPSVETSFVGRRLARMARNEAATAGAVYYAAGVEAAVVAAAGFDNGSWPTRIYTDAV